VDGETRAASQPVQTPAVGPVPACATPGPQQLLAIQRSAGNRAVARLIDAPARRLARCDCGGHAGGQCHCGKDTILEDEESPAVRAAGTAALRRAVASRRALQRSPAYRPNPAWSKAGRDNPPPTCTPFTGIWGTPAEAEAKWQLYSNVLPGQVTARCGCSKVGDAYTKYLSATGGTNTLLDDGNCISEQLAKDKDAHSKVESDRLLAWAKVRNDFTRRSLPTGTTDVELDLIEAEKGNLVVTGSAPRKLQVDEVTYRVNTLAGGLLFGSGHDPGDPPDSECGDDTRVMTATIKLHRLDDGSDPSRMSVKETVTFRYSLHDGFDFCPGNTIQMTINWSEPAEVIKQRLEYNQLLTDLSRLEASGMARDVCFDVQYHRTLPDEVRTIPIPGGGP
jgi:hypothetical protein